MTPTPSNPYNLLHFELIGSIGMQGKQATNGGGHVHIEVDSFDFQGDNTPIRANGLPILENKDFLEDVNGGSGGYIYVKAYNKITKENVLDPFSRFEAIGGYGKNKGYGGAGGVIILDF